MCMQDIAIGRKAHSADNNVQLTVGVPIQLVPANQNRVVLIISSSSLADLQLYFSMPSSAQFGMLIKANSVPFVLNIKDHFDIVRRAIYCMPTATGQMSWWEATFPHNSGDESDIG